MNVGQYVVIKTGDKSYSGLVYKVIEKGSGKHSGLSKLENGGWTEDSLLKVVAKPR